MSFLGYNLCYQYKILYLFNRYNLSKRVVSQDMLPYSILQYIVEEGGGLKNGHELTKLPRMDDLARELGVSRGKLREEMIAAQAYGVVEKSKVERDGEKIFSGYREVVRLLDEAHRLMVLAAESQARISQDQSDLGNLVSTNLFGIDYLKSIRYLIWLEMGHWHL